MLDEFSATVDKLYAAAADAARWGEALAAVEQLTGSAGAVVHIVFKRGPSELVTMLGKSAQGYFLPEHVDEWTRDYAPMCPRLAAASRWPDAPYYVDYMLMSEREMDLNPVYNWYGSYGLRYFIGSRLCDDDQTEMVWSLQRRTDQGHAQQGDVDLFQLLKPHVARSLSLARELGTLRTFDRFSSAMLESLPQAVFALDANGQVQFANDRARGLLAAADGLGIHDGKLATANAADQSRLDALIAGASNAIPAASRGWGRVGRPSGRLPYAVFVAPLAAADDELLPSKWRVLVLVNALSEERPVDAAVLTDVYDLTYTEAQLASAIAVGHSPESAAALLHMQIATARSHLKSIFHKLGVHRQQDLVRLLTSLSAMHI